MNNGIRVLYFPQGKAHEVATVLGTKDDQLRVLQGMVGGYLEAVPFHRGRAYSVDFFVDEEGRLKQRPPNLILPSGLLLVGDVVVVQHDSEGELMDLSLSIIDEVIEKTMRVPWLRGGS